MIPLTALQRRGRSNARQDAKHAKVKLGIALGRREHLSLHAAR